MLLFLLVAPASAQETNLPLRPKGWVYQPNGAAILTPSAPAEPRINGPWVFGVRPRSPFLFTIAATGDRPMQFAAEGLPKGLSLDASTGRVTGVLAERGEHRVLLRARNHLGAAERELRIVVGDQLALTPPMGWNSWNCFAGKVDADKMLRAARAMVASGLANHGWSYINLDDAWQGKRGGPFGAIQGNERFPDMQGLFDQIHALGLKVGLYSTPWKHSYAGYAGSTADNADGTSWRPERVFGRYYLLERDYGKRSFVQSDVRQWAAWGVDYLKYDWHPLDKAHAEEMALELRQCGRDIVYSLSNRAPFEQAADWARLSHCWRTTADIADTWRSVSRIGFSQERWAPFAGPGHWPDPDMLVIGRVGWGAGLSPTRLAPDEQVSHVSLWCLLPAPLLIGCDLERLDPFTLGLLTNDEVLDVNQDPLGRPARRVARRQGVEVWARELEDGSLAVGLFNRSRHRSTGTAAWTDLGLSGRRVVRDLWRQQDLGVFVHEFRAAVPPHGVVLVRILPAD